jgi:hypothetical protein
MSLETTVIERLKSDVVALIAAGVEVLAALGDAARVLVAEAAELGTDLAETAVATVKGAIGAASDLAVEAEDAASAAATGAIEAAGEVSDAAKDRVFAAVSGTVDGVKVVVKSVTA